MQVNPIDYAVISQALIAAAREMGAKLIRSAYSTILREARDGSPRISLGTDWCSGASPG